MRTRTHATRITSKTVFLLAGLCLLTACSSGGSDEGTVADQPNSPPPASGGSSNDPPSISGNPPSAVKIGEGYDFRPTASDPNGDTITFSVQSKPSWTTFSSSTGRLNGTPQAGDEGTYDGIRITASDGSASDSMTFSVTVTQVATGSVSLSWTPPQENTDGTALTDLSGYKIYYGTSSGSYPNRITIDSSGITTYVVENLSPNTYYFAATAVNSSGIESDFSGEAVKSIN